MYRFLQKLLAVNLKTFLDILFLPPAKFGCSRLFAIITETNCENGLF